MATTWLETAGVNALRKDISNGTKTCSRSYAETLSDMSYGKGLNHQSAAEPLSLIIQIRKCSESINGFEPEGL